MPDYSDLLCVLNSFNTNSYPHIRKTFFHQFMGLKGKSATELSTEEIKEVLAIVVKLSWKLHKLTHIYSSKELLNKSSIKFGQRKSVASLFLLFQMSQGKLDPRRLYSPKELNKKIAENLIHESQADTNDMTSFYDQKVQYKKFISSKEFTELLRVFERSKLLDRITGKKEIKKFRSEAVPEIMGRPEAYKLSTNVTHIQSLLSRSEVINLIVQSLEESRLLSNFLENVLMASILLFRDLDEKHIHIGMKSINPEEVLDLETLGKSLRPKKEKLLAFDHQTIEKVSRPILKEIVSEIINKSDNFVTGLIILLSLSEL